MHVINILIPRVVVNRGRSRKQAGAYSMNDVKGRFGIIVHTVAIIVLMSFGLPYNAARILFLV
jgi:hypothetical protein